MTDGERPGRDGSGDGVKSPDLMTRHFGAVVTAVVALAAAGLGFVQFTIQSARLEQEQQARLAQDEREWKLALTRFAVDNYPKIFSDDAAQRARLQALMQATFPDTILAAFYEAQVREATTFQQVQQSTEALRALTTRAARAPAAAPDEAPAERAPTPPPEPMTVEATAFVQYNDEADQPRLEGLLADLRAQGFRTPGLELVEKFAIKPDVRYFHAADRAAAERALAVLENLLQNTRHRPPVTPTDLGQTYPNVPEGIVEIWVPDLGEAPS